MKVARGRVHIYVGVTLYFTVYKVVKVTMIRYVNEIIETWDKACDESQDGFQQVTQSDSP
jgi:hypothetical protein